MSRQTKTKPAPAAPPAPRSNDRLLKALVEAIDELLFNYAIDEEGDEAKVARKILRRRRNNSKNLDQIGRPFAMAIGASVDKKPLRGGSADKKTGMVDYPPLKFPKGYIKMALAMPESDPDEQEAKQS